jgi:2,3-bisphosphoglycerate-independent phosphoglycerate mutase
MNHQPLVLVILDGWGHSEVKEHNAINTAHKPTWDWLWQHCPHSLLTSSGVAVGLPDGQMGNSEVGHLTIGAGRLVPQDYTRIDKAIASGDFFQNPVLRNAVQQAVQNNKALHIMGLLSPGGVHSHETHIMAMVELAAQQGVRQVYIHAFLDGRDTAPRSAAASLQALEQKLALCKIGKIVSLCGRFYAMDRDQRWERIQAAYELIAKAKASYHAESAMQALELAYARGESDEFVQATRISANGHPGYPINDGDVLVFMNFRADRARQLSRAFLQTHFTGFNRKHVPQLSDFVSLSHYADDIPSSIAFPAINMRNGLGEIISKQGWQQLRIAETEKYAHVTFFFNGGIESAFDGEERILIPSPAVKTYNLQPAMSAEALTEKLTAAIVSKRHAVIICNFANPDMVGHTGDFNATVTAIEVIDRCLQRIVAATQKADGELLITADHGNAECMYDIGTGQQHTAHTNDPVPLIFMGRKANFIHDDGSLADIAPTMLYLLGVDRPAEMTGRVLLDRQE